MVLHLLLFKNKINPPPTTTTTTTTTPPPPTNVILLGNHQVCFPKAQALFVDQIKPCIKSVWIENWLEKLCWRQTFGIIHKVPRSYQQQDFSPPCHCHWLPWTFRLNIGLNTSPSDSLVSYLNSHLGYSAGEFQALQLIVLAVFGAVD